MDLLFFCGSIQKNWLHKACSQPFTVQFWVYAVSPLPSGVTSIMMMSPARTPSPKMRRAARVSTFFWR